MTSKILICMKTGEGLGFPTNNDGVELVKV
jgi:hypothetical protein